MTQKEELALVDVIETVSCTTATSPIRDYG